MYSRITVSLILALDANVVGCSSSMPHGLYHSPMSERNFYSR